MSLVYDVQGTASVVVRRDVPFAGELVMDLYSRPDATPPLPAVVIVAGYPDPGFQRKLGFRFKDMPSNAAWARLIATLGYMAVTYTNEDPARGRRSTSRRGRWPTRRGLTQALRGLA